MTSLSCCHQCLVRRITRQWPSIRHRSADPATRPDRIICPALPCPARQASKRASKLEACESEGILQQQLSQPPTPHVARQWRNGAKHNADPPEILCESCLLRCSPSCPPSALGDHERPVSSRPSTSHVGPLAIVVIVTFLASALLHHPSPFVCVCVCVLHVNTRQLRSASIEHPPFMYVLSIPARPYLVQGLRSARAEGASGGGSAVAAAGVACRTIDATCTTHLMPRVASSRLHVHVSEKTSIL